MKKYYAITEINGQEVLAIKHELSDDAFRRKLLFHGLDGSNGMTRLNGCVDPSIGYKFIGSTSYGFFKGQEHKVMDTTSFWVNKGKHLDLESIVTDVIPDAIRVDISAFNYLELNDIALSKAGRDRESLKSANEASAFFTTKLSIK